MSCGTLVQAEWRAKTQEALHLCGSSGCTLVGWRSVAGRKPTDEVVATIPPVTSK